MQTRAFESNQSMRQEHAEQENLCQICNIGSQQTTCILAHLLLQLKSVNLEEENQNIFECGGFTKLMKLIFHSKCKNFRDTIKCPHTKTIQYFLQKLGVTIGELNRASNIKIIDLAKYNFHSDVISLQVKSFSRHFAKNQSKKQNKKIKRKIRTPQKTQKTARTSIVDKKYKQQQKQSQNKQPQIQQNLQPMIKQQHDFGHETVRKNPQYLQYQSISSTFPYHTIRFDNDFSQMMGNVVMLNYGFHPLNQP